MAADTTILQGELMEDPREQKLDVEAILAGFLSSLLREQNSQNTPGATTAEVAVTS